MNHGDYECLHLLQRPEKGGGYCKREESDIGEKGYLFQEEALKQDLA